MVLVLVFRHDAPVNRWFVNKSFEYKLDFIRAKGRDGRKMRKFIDKVREIGVQLPAMSSRLVSSDW